MFLDLHEGILEEFAAAQRPMSHRCEDRVEAWRARRLSAQREEKRLGSARHRAAARRVPARWEAAQRRRRGWKDAAAARLRETREALRVGWAPPRPRVVVVACARCGAPVERREGCRDVIYHPCKARAAKEGVK